MKKNKPDKGNKNRKKQKSELEIRNSFVAPQVTDSSHLVTLKPTNEITLAPRDVIKLTGDPITVTIPTNQPIVNLDALRSARATFESIKNSHEKLAGTILPTLEVANGFAAGLKHTLDAASSLPLNIVSDSVFENTQKVFSQISAMDRPINVARESLLAFDASVSQFREAISGNYLTDLQSQFNKAVLTISASLVEAPYIVPTTIKPLGWPTPPIRPQVDIAVGESSVTAEKKYSHSEVKAIVRTEVEGIKTYFEAKITGLEQKLINRLKTPLLPASTEAKNELPTNFVSKYAMGKEGLEYDVEVIIAASQNWRSSGEPNKDATNSWKVLNALFPNRLEVAGSCEKQWGEPMTYEDLKAKTGCADPRREVRRLKSLIEESGHSNKVELKTVKKPRSQKILMQLVVFDSLPTPHT